MNEFEWLQQTRTLARPIAPRRDLWPDIEATLATPQRSSRRRPGSVSIAATLALAMLSAASIHLSAPPETVPPAQATRWKPGDPRLAAAAIDLDAAQTELTHALRDDPRADYLRRLLQRTQDRRNQLRKLDHLAG